VGVARSTDGFVEEWTYSTANFRGLNESTGNKKKQMTKQAAAPKLQAENARMRSHRLTAKKRKQANQQKQSSSPSPKDLPS